MSRSAHIRVWCSPVMARRCIALRFLTKRTGGQERPGCLLQSISTVPRLIRRSGTLSRHRRTPPPIAAGRCSRPTTLPTPPGKCSRPTTFYKEDRSGRHRRTPPPVAAGRCSRPTTLPTPPGVPPGVAAGKCSRPTTFYKEDRSGRGFPVLSSSLSIRFIHAPSFPVADYLGRDEGGLEGFLQLFGCTRGLSQIVRQRSRGR